MNVAYTPAPPVPGTVTIEMSEQEAKELFVLIGSLSLDDIKRQLQDPPTARLARNNNVEAMPVRKTIARLYTKIGDALGARINKRF